MLSSSSRQRWIITIVAAAAGAALYGVSIYLTAVLDIPGADNVQVRPGVAIPVVCGALFGPLAGFVAGFAGNFATDWLLGWGFWPFWYIGNGIMGLAGGIYRGTNPNFARLSTAASVTSRAVAGIFIGMSIASISELWDTQSSWSDVVYVNFLPAFLSNTVNVVILVPIILLIYGILYESTQLERG